MEKISVAIFLSKSDRLGFTMQHLYLLHWVAEELMKKFCKIDLTLGKNINKRKDIHKKKSKALYGRYEMFLKGVIFRNDVAHNGIIWEPKGFEEAIKKYKKGIELLENDFNQDLEKEFMPKRKEMVLSKRDEFSTKYFDVVYHVVKDTLVNYNTRLEYVENMSSGEDKDIKPAANTLHYLYKTFEDSSHFSESDNKKIDRIKEILKKENHER